MNQQVSKAAELTLTQNAVLLEEINQQKKKLFEFIRKRVPDNEDAEDILQDVFYQFIETARAMKPVEQITSWLFTVARNKIIDLYRKKKPQAFSRMSRANNDDPDMPELFELLHDPGDNPETRYYRGLIQNELEVSLALLPPEQRDVFTAHEFEGISFKELSVQKGLSVNTLLSRKRYAVLFLRSRLSALYQETFGA